MRLHYKLLLLLIPIALGWTQYVTAEHVWLDHAGVDDCMVCKIAGSGCDNTNLIDISYTVFLSVDRINTYFSEDSFSSILWDIPLSRGPPVS